MRLCCVACCGFVRRGEGIELGLASAMPLSLDAGTVFTFGLFSRDSFANIT